MVVKIGMWLLSYLGSKLAHLSPKKVGDPDWFAKRYGGRLPGGGNIGTKGKGGIMAYGPGTGISAREALGESTPSNVPDRPTDN
eukprot:10308784-Karenia_brevis.AAC.1